MPISTHTAARQATKLSATQEAYLVTLYRKGEHTVSELEELFAVSGSTVYRAIERTRIRETP